MMDVDINQLFHAGFQDMEEGLDVMELAGRRAHHKVLQAVVLPRIVEDCLKNDGEALPLLLVHLKVMTRPEENENVKRDNLELWQDEKEHLYALFREAIDRTGDQVPWAAIYLLVFFADLVRMHVQRRLNPDVILKPPSAFVYCMQ